MDHDGCEAAGMPCEHPDCPPVTGLVCRGCHRPVATVDKMTATVVTFLCPSCGNTWYAEANGPLDQARH
jgi:predicted CXXCH cytochrome family protein